jgi:hypothetical protein
VRNRNHGGCHYHHGQNNKDAYQALHALNLRQGAFVFQSRNATGGRGNGVFVVLIIEFIVAARSGGAHR